ncbi:MAG: carboxypeptidase regulatory-like domain-containing protein [Planctomycetes bacterium]|nr:carboxypeptidase regulatory-like domain-containing protein [Planctomycetota bacterium]
MSVRKLKSLQQFGVWAAIAVLVASPQCLLAAETSILKSSTTAHVAPALTVVDVALQADGLLHGQIVDKQGQPVAATKIHLTDGRKEWRTQTDAKGLFQLTGISGATYSLQVGQQVQLLRIWATGTAPPSATSGVLFIQDSDVVLAQNCGSPVCGSPVGAGRRGGFIKQALSNPWVVGGLVAAAVAIPVAIHNADDDPASP